LPGFVAAGDGLSAGREQPAETAAKSRRANRRVPDGCVMETPGRLQRRAAARSRGYLRRPATSAAILRRNVWIYGIGGIIVPFIFIKLIDLVLVAIHAY